MTELQNQNFTLKRPLSGNGYQATARHSGMQKAESLGGQQQQSQPSANRSVRQSLELYGGTGDVRSEQPSARGTKIDITV